MKKIEPKDYVIDLFNEFFDKLHVDQSTAAALVLATVQKELVENIGNEIGLGVAWGIIDSNRN